MRKYWLYLRYVIRHKWAVYRAGKACGVSWWRRIKHDFSKLRPSEFLPYAEFFYGKTSLQSPGTDGPKSFKTSIAAKEAFDVAWLKHQQRNDHHFQSWILYQDDGKVVALKMKEQAMRELCADYLGMSWTLHKHWDATKWYYANKPNIILHPETEREVEFLLKKAGAGLSR